MRSVTFSVRSLAWFATGALLSAAVALALMSAWRVDAAPGDGDATFVPITPCRLADTRPTPDRVGSAGTLSAAATQTFAVHGTNGECTIPSEAVAVAMNVTALGASTLTFLTFWPDGARPLAASLNPAQGEPPTPNAVTVDLSSVGDFNVYNEVGTVNVVIDVNGYYINSSLKELASRLTAVEAAHAAGVDPTVLARIDTLESGIATLEADSATAAEDIAALEGETTTNAGEIAELRTGQPVVVHEEYTPGIVDGCLWGGSITPCSPFSGSPTSTMQELTLSAPAAGFVTVIATGYVADASAAGDDIACEVMESEGDPTPASRMVWNGSPESPLENITLTRTFPVPSAGDATYYLRCVNLDAASSTFQAGTMTAIWTPDS